MFKTDIPNKIKQPPVCCLNCGKSYIKKANLRKHEVTCELLYPNKHRRQIANIDEEEEVPSYRELFMMVRELGTKYKKLEKKIEEYEKIVHREKRKINILEWLNKNQIPEYIFDNLESKIEINDTHIEYLFNHSYFEVIKQIYKDYFDKDTSISFRPIFGFSEKQNQLYIYTTQNTTNIWIELNKDIFIRFNCIIQRNLSKVFQNWKQKNRQKIEESENLEQICNKTLIKIMTPDCKENKTNNRLKNILYLEIKTDIKDLLEYEVEF